MAILRAFRPNMKIVRELQRERGIPLKQVYSIISKELENIMNI